MGEHCNFMQYQPGDHVALYPVNPTPVIERVLQSIQDCPPTNQLINLEIQRERVTTSG